MDEMSPTVFIVDDDEDLRESLEYLIHSVRLPTRCFASGADFLSAFDANQPGCLLCDVRMPELGGLELAEKLEANGYHLPIIFMTAFADVPMAVRALKLGACEFIEKPFNAQMMLDRIQRALEQDRLQRATALLDAEFSRKLLDLTVRERDTLEMILTGTPNKSIAAKLEITERAVELRRASLMKKLGTHTVAELIRLVTRHQVHLENRQH